MDTAIQLQALEIRLATSPVQAATANVGSPAVAVTVAVVNVPQKPRASSMRAVARSPRRQLSALQSAAATEEARLPKITRLLTNFMMTDFREADGSIKLAGLIKDRHNQKRC